LRKLGNRDIHKLRKQKGHILNTDQVSSSASTMKISYLVLKIESSKRLDF